MNVEAPELPALYPGNACQCGGHTFVVITREAAAVLCAGAEDLGRGRGSLMHVSGCLGANGDGFLP